MAIMAITKTVIIIGTAIRTDAVAAIRLLRCFTIAVGTAGIGWGLFDLPYFWRGAPLESVAGRIISGIPFSAEALAGLMPAAEAVERDALCRPTAVRSAAILRLRIFEDGFSAENASKLDALSQQLENSIHLALSCAPADPFLWQVLFTLESTRNGFRPEYLEFVRMSYRLGPNEGWIMLKRCPAMLALFERLPPDLADEVVDEFARITANGFTRRLPRSSAAQDGTSASGF